MSPLMGPLRFLFVVDCDSHVTLPPHTEPTEYIFDLPDR